MTSGRLELVSAVRRILVKHWLDVSKVRIQIAATTAILRGTLRKSREDDPVDGLFIEGLEQKIRGIEGVTKVRWHLENWIVSRGQWKPKEP